MSRRRRSPATRVRPCVRLNADILVAADGSDPKPLLPHADLDCNASFSSDHGAPP
jgi:hypothetical protein